MKLLPALDLMGERPVRLSQGDFDRRTDYGETPADALAAFAEAGAEMAHVVDLDGTRAKMPRQHDFIATLTDILPLQVAGGVRGGAHVKQMLDGGAARVVIGSLAVNEPDQFAAILDTYGADRITLALDVRLEDGVPMVARHGWAEGSGQSLTDVLSQFPTVRHLLVTDIAKDGMMQGPNVDLYRELSNNWSDKEVQASGGVSRLEDLDALRDAGAAAAIVGKAIWEGKFTAAEGVARARG